MGFDRRVMAMFLRVTTHRFDVLRGLQMCEFGAQHIFHAAIPILQHVGYQLDVEDVQRLANSLFMQRHWASVTTSKKLFTFLGMQHVSFDLFPTDGALKVDLSQPFNRSSHVMLYLQRCDIVSNIGTTEHIGQGKTGPGLIRGQYEAFRTMHALTNPGGGLMVHAVPLTGCYPEHGSFDYAPEFFRSLAYLMEYVVLNLTVFHINLDWSKADRQRFWGRVKLVGAMWPPVVKYPTAQYAEELMLFVVLARTGTRTFVSFRDFVRLQGLHLTMRRESSSTCGRHFHRAFLSPLNLQP